MAWGLFSRKGSTARSRAQVGNVQDPVCHMMVDPDRAAATSTHGQSAYMFCSTACKERFDADPHKYLGAHNH